ncbi:MAG: DUF935 family protein [Pseudomonadota bacterium]
MADGLYLPNGTFQPFQHESLSTIVASRENADQFLGGAGSLESWLAILPDPDPVLRKRGDDASVLRDLLADDQVTTAVLERKNRVLNSPHFTLRAGAPEGETPSPEATRLYDAFMRDLERVNLRTIISGILDAPFFGMTPLELVWKYSDSWWHLVDIIPRPAHWFAFNPENVPVFVGNYGSLCADPQAIPVGKCIFATHHATYDNPYGLRLLSRCLWPVAFKRGGLEFYSRFVERHGMPWVVGKAPSKAAPDDKRTMAANLARMVQDCVAVIPSGSEVNFLTAGQTQSGLYEAFLDRQDRALSKILMGQTLTVEMEGANNSLAAAETHKGVADELADADKAMVVDAWNEIAWLYAQVNMPSTVRAPLASYEEPEDLLSRAELDKKLYEIGVSFTEEHFTENYGLKASEFRLKTSPSTQNVEGASNFASPQKEPLAIEAQNGLDKALTTMLPKALQANAPFIQRVEKAIQEANDYDELAMTLAGLLAPNLSPSELEAYLASAMTAAAGFGASAAHENVDGDA